MDNSKVIGFYSLSGDGNDIALLELENAVIFNSYIKPICLTPKSTPVPVGDICVVTGWGRTSKYCYPYYHHLHWKIKVIENFF